MYFYDVNIECVRDGILVARVDEQYLLLEKNH